MKHSLYGLFLLIYLSCMTSIAHAGDLRGPEYHTKLYFDSHDLEILDDIICIHFENNLIETHAIRTDQNGFYIFDTDITNYGIETEKIWKCPYCNYWWELGEKCKNPDCPTNRW